MELLTSGNITSLDFVQKDTNETDVVRFEKDRLQICFVNHKDHKTIMVNFKQGFFKETDKGCIAWTDYTNLFAKTEISLDDFKVFDAVINSVKTLKS